MNANLFKKSRRGWTDLFGSFAFIGGKKENQAYRKQIDRLAKKNSSHNAATTLCKGRT